MIMSFMWNVLHTLWLVDGNSTECGGNVTGSYGRLHSINFPFTYPKNLDCYWTIVSPVGTTLSVRFLQIGLDDDCGNEFLQVTEHGNGIRMCNHTLPKPFQAAGNVVNVHFVSDNKNDPYNSGFNIEWKVKSLYTLHVEHLTWTEAQEVCTLNGGALVSEYDVTEMVNLVRGDDIKTVWHGKNFTQWAWLEAPTQQPSKCYTLSKMKSSSMLHEAVAGCNEKKSFICEQVPITCGENLTDLHGEIYSPGYPTGYGAYLRCVWNLVVAVGSSISLSYEVDIENSSLCRRDYVKIIEPHNGNPLTVCGESAGTFTTTSNTVTIIFLSDKTVQETKGFNASWSSGPKIDGISIGMLLTLISMCFIGVALMVSAAIYYRKRKQQIPDTVGSNVEFRTRMASSAIRTPGQSEPVFGNNDSVQRSVASFEVSSDFNYQPEDETDYENLTFRGVCRQGPYSELIKGTGMVNHTYALPYGHIADTSGAVRN